MGDCMEQGGRWFIFGDGINRNVLVIDWNSVGVHFDGSYGNFLNDLRILILIAVLGDVMCRRDLISGSFIFNCMLSY